MVAGTAADLLSGGRSSLRQYLRPLWPIILLSVVPALVFGLPAAAGHLLIFQDNLRQNYPLRVLVGRDLASGHLPLWDPYIWSGTPLLAGFNAGAAYPLSWLFALLPGPVAWVTIEWAQYSATAIGTYLLLRDSGMGIKPAAGAAAVFAFSGAAAAQVVHVDMTSGIASLPWILIALRRVVLEGRAAWVLWLGAAYSMVVLGGAPEAMMDEAIVALVYAVAIAGTRLRHWLRLLLGGTAAGLVALGLSAVLWWPGLAFIAQSQRAGLGKHFFASGSYPPADFLLAVLPYLFGGYGQLNQPYFFGQYNLPEVSIYIGILPLIGALTMLAGRRRAGAPKAEMRAWTMVGAAALVLALGNHTPLEPLLSHIPLYGHQRLQSRNILGVDLAAAALFGWWLDRNSWPRTHPMGAWEKFAALVPFVVALLASASFAVAPMAMTWALQRTRPTAVSFGAVDQALAVSVVLSALAGWHALRVGKGDERRWRRLGLGLVVVDLCLYSIVGELPSSPSPSTLRAGGPIMRMVAATAGKQGRYAVYDPQLYDYFTLRNAGNPDLGILRSLPSVQGYASIVSASYNATTATHAQANLSTSYVNRAVEQLNLRELTTLPESFLNPLAKAPAPDGSVSPSILGYGQSQTMPQGNNSHPPVPAPQTARSRPPLSPKSSEGWFFGTAVTPRSVGLVLNSPAPGGRLSIGLIGKGGSVDWQAPLTLSRSRYVSISTKDIHQRIIGIEVLNLSGRALPIGYGILQATKHFFVTSGALANAVSPKTWRWVGQVQGWSVFGVDQPARPAWLKGPSKTPGRATVVDGPSGSSVTISVRTTTPGLLVWSEAYSPGWHAKLKPAAPSHSRPRPISLHPYGLIQAMAVPAGNYSVVLTYDPPRIAQGIWASGTTLVVVASSFLFLYRRRAARGHWPPPGSRAI